MQACAWPPALSGKDVVGIAETGSGKTLAFGIPALARLLPSSGAGNGPRALVLAPTRELVLQMYDALSALDVVRCAAVFGGVDKAQQVRAIKGVQVVIGTPGRVLDLIGDGTLALGGVEQDEADRMLDKGFENDIRRIIGYAKQGAERQTLMCMSISASSPLLGIDVKRANGSQCYLARGGASVGRLVLVRCHRTASQPEPDHPTASSRRLVRFYFSPFKTFPDRNAIKFSSAPTRQWQTSLPSLPLKTNSRIFGSLRRESWV